MPVLPANRKPQQPRPPAPPQGPPQGSPVTGANKPRMDLSQKQGSTVNGMPAAQFQQQNPAMFQAGGIFGPSTGQQQQRQGAAPGTQPMQAAPGAATGTIADQLAAPSQNQNPVVLRRLLQMLMSGAGRG